VIKDTLEDAIVGRQRGLIYTLEHNYGSAIKALTNAKCVTQAILEEEQVPEVMKCMADVLFNLSYISLRMNPDKNVGLDHAKQALEFYCLIGNSDGIINVSATIGDNYRQMGQLTNSLSAFESSWKHLSEYPNARAKAVVALDLAETHLMLGNRDSAGYYFHCFVAGVMHHDVTDTDIRNLGSQFERVAAYFPPPTTNLK
jgi:hypothetical protein